MHGFSKYHNFIFELNGIRVWRADGVGKGIVIPYQDTIVRPQGPTDLVVDVHFFFQSRRLESIRLRQVMRNKATISSSALRLDIRWCSRNSVTLRVILMLANTVKNAEAPKWCIWQTQKSLRGKIPYRWEQRGDRQRTSGTYRWASWQKWSFCFL